MEDLVGRTLAHFRIEALIGEGGMGVVYRATDEKLGREAAIKVLPTEWGKDAERRARFLREARSAAAVTHPNIATVYEVGEADGHVFIAMELIDGEPLRARIGQLSVDDAAQIALDVARGLARAHDKGIVHRDLKPENVMVTRDGAAKILDFGLAKVPEAGGASASALGSMATEAAVAVTREGQVMGSPPYMSPEQARGAATDARTDVFSFGVVVYEMLAGHRPFRGETAVEILYAVLRAEPEPIATLVPAAPPDLVEVVTRCLSKAKEDRFASAREIVVALGGRRTGSSVSPPIPGGDGSRVPSVTSGKSGLAFEPTVISDDAHLSLPAKADAPKTRRKTVPLVAAGLALALVGGGVALRQHEHHAVSANPEAARLYEQATRAFDQGESADVEWLRAVELDPQLCEAHLRLAAFQSRGTARPSEELEKIRRCQARMSEEDRALADVVSASLAIPPDAEAMRDAATRAAKRFGGDAEVPYYVCSYERDTDPADALGWCERAVRAEAGFIPTYGLEASILENLGRANDAAAALDKCLEIRPDALSCTQQRFRAFIAAGKCSDARTLARGILSRRPSLPNPYVWLGDTLLGEAAPRESVEQVWRDADQRAGDAAGAQRSRMIRARREALTYGDFPKALESSDEIDRFEATNTDASPHWTVTRGRVHVLIETGQADEARAEMTKFLRIIPGFAKELSAEDAIAMHQLAFEVGAQTREALDAALARQTQRLGAMDPAARWVVLSAPDDPTPEQAKDALQRAPPELSGALGKMAPEKEARVGITLLRGGRPDAALPWLEAATLPCYWYGGSSAVPLEMPRVRAFFALGQAREKKGDTKGARAAYEDVLRRWGEAKPRSMTADAARAALAALHGD